jgi:hypothetical protein
MMQLDTTIIQQYYEKKSRAEKAYFIFSNCPNIVTDTDYRMALTEFQDFCVQEIAKLVGDTEYTNCGEENEE